MIYVINRCILFVVVCLLLLQNNNYALFAKKSSFAPLQNFYDKAQNKNIVNIDESTSRINDSALIKAIPEYFNKEKAFIEIAKDNNAFKGGYYHDMFKKKLINNYLQQNNKNENYKIFLYDLIKQQNKLRELAGISLFDILGLMESIGLERNATVENIKISNDALLNNPKEFLALITNFLKNYEKHKDKFINNTMYNFHGLQNTSPYDYLKLETDRKNILIETDLHEKPFAFFESIITRLLDNDMSGIYAFLGDISDFRNWNGKVDESRYDLNTRKILTTFAGLTNIIINATVPIRSGILPIKGNHETNLGVLTQDLKQLFGNEDPLFQEFIKLFHKSINDLHLAFSIKPKSLDKTLYFSHASTPVSILDFLKAVEAECKKLGITDKKNNEEKIKDVIRSLLNVDAKDHEKKVSVIYDLFKENPESLAWYDLYSGDKAAIKAGRPHKLSIDDYISLVDQNGLCFAGHSHDGNNTPHLIKKAQNNQLCGIPDHDHQKVKLEGVDFIGHDEHNHYLKPGEVGKYNLLCPYCGGFKGSESYPTQLMLTIDNNNIRSEYKKSPVNTSQTKNVSQANNFAASNNSENNSTIENYKKNALIKATIAASALALLAGAYYVKSNKDKKNKKDKKKNKQKSKSERPYQKFFSDNLVHKDGDLDRQQYE